MQACIGSLVSFGRDPPAMGVKFVAQEGYHKGQRFVRLEALDASGTLITMKQWAELLSSNSVKGRAFRELFAAKLSVSYKSFDIRLQSLVSDEMLHMKSTTSKPFFFEMPSATESSRPFECTLIESSELERQIRFGKAHPAAFAKHMSPVYSDDGHVEYPLVAELAIKGKNEILVVPCVDKNRYKGDLSSLAMYSDLKSFMKLAPQKQVSAFLMQVGTSFVKLLETNDNAPLYLSTNMSGNGDGTNWLRLRFTRNPKDYFYGPYNSEDLVAHSSSKHDMCGPGKEPETEVTGTRRSGSPSFNIPRHTKAAKGAGAYDSSGTTNLVQENPSSYSSHTRYSESDNDSIVFETLGVPGYFDGRMKRYGAMKKESGSRVSVREWAETMAQDTVQGQQCRENFRSTIENAPFKAVLFETPGATSDSSNQQFEFVLIESQALHNFGKRGADAQTFATHFSTVSPSSGGVAFDNLGRDARLVAPLPSHQENSVNRRGLTATARTPSHKAGRTRGHLNGMEEQPSLACYAHLANFVRGAPRQQVLKVLQLVSREYLKHLQQRPNSTIWLSTSGLGVAWLHFRLGSSPKYYEYAPYARKSW